MPRGCSHRLFHVVAFWRSPLGVGFCVSLLVHVLVSGLVEVAGVLPAGAGLKSDERASHRFGGEDDLFRRRMVLSVAPRVEAGVALQVSKVWAEKSVAFEGLGFNQQIQGRFVDASEHFNIVKGLLETVWLATTDSNPTAISSAGLKGSVVEADEHDSAPAVVSGEAELGGVGNSISRSSHSDSTISDVESGDHRSRGTGVKPDGGTPRERGWVGPTLLSLSEPRYPASCRDAGEQGVVLVEVEVLADGDVGRVRVVRDPGYPRLVSEALSVVRSARFRPAVVEGEAVATRVVLPIHFVLK